MEGEPSRRTFLSEAYTEYPSPVDAGTGIPGIRPRPATFVMPRHVRVEPSGEARANDPFQQYVRHRKDCRVQRMTAFTYSVRRTVVDRHATYLHVCRSLGYSCYLIRGARVCVSLNRLIGGYVICAGIQPGLTPQLTILGGGSKHHALHHEVFRGFQN